LSFGVTKYASAPQTAVIKLSTNIIPKEILPPRIAAPTTPAVHCTLRYPQILMRVFFGDHVSLRLKYHMIFLKASNIFPANETDRRSPAALSRIPRPLSLGEHAQEAQGALERLGEK